MTCPNATNERVKRRYFYHLKEAEGLTEKTVDQTARSLLQYEEFVAHKDFVQFKVEDAVAYKKLLLSAGGRNSAEVSSRSTVRTKLNQVQKFFRWLAGQPGFKAAISYSDVKYFNLSARDVRLAKGPLEKPTPTLEQVQHVIRSMPAGNDLQLRDRAFLACVLLTGVRVSACISLRLKHVRHDQLGIDQDGREVKTKLGKSTNVFFFPVGEDVRLIFLEYVDHLRKRLLFSDNDPLFPQTKLVVGGRHKFESDGLSRLPWATPGAACDIFRQGFEAAGLPYHTPHSLRRTLTRLGQRVCDTPEKMKAWSQNLSHDEVTTTLTSYGHVPVQRQAVIMSEFNRRSAQSEDILVEYGPMLSDPRVRQMLDLLKGTT